MTAAYIVQHINRIPDEALSRKPPEMHLSTPPSPSRRKCKAQQNKAGQREGAPTLGQTTSFHRHTS